MPKHWQTSPEKHVDDTAQAIAQTHSSVTTVTTVSKHKCHPIADIKKKLLIIKMNNYKSMHTGLIHIFCILYVNYNIFVINHESQINLIKNNLNAWNIFYYHTDLAFSGMTTMDV